MSTDYAIAIGEMRKDPRSKLFPRALKAKFTVEQKRKLIMGKSITITNSQLKGTSKKKGGEWHVFFLTDAQYHVALQQLHAGKSYKLKFSPLEREYNARYSSGFFDDVWGGIKSAANTVYSTVKKGVNSSVGKAILRGVDVAASVLSEGALPPGLISGVTGAVFAEDPEPEQEPEQDLEADVPDADYEPLPQIHPKTCKQYSFPSPPTKPNGEAYTNASPPPLPRAPPPSKKVSKHPGPLPALPAPIVGTDRNIPQAPAYGSGFRRGRKGGMILHNNGIVPPMFKSQAVILSSKPRLGVQRMPSAPIDMLEHEGKGLYMPTVVGGGARRSTPHTLATGSGIPRVIQTKNGPRYHDGRRFVSAAAFQQLAGPRAAKGLNIPQIQAF